MDLTPRLRTIAAELAAERAVTAAARDAAAVTRQEDTARACLIEWLESWGIDWDDIDPDRIHVELDIDETGEYLDAGAVAIEGLRFRATWPNGILNSPRLDLTRLCPTCGADVVLDVPLGFLDRMMETYDGPLPEHDAGLDERCDGRTVTRVTPPAPPLPYRLIGAETAGELEVRLNQLHAEGYRVLDVDVKAWPLTAVLAHVDAG